MSPLGCGHANLTRAQAVQTALNAVWGIMTHFGGAADPDNPGPGDVFEQLAPVDLGD